MIELGRRWPEEVSRGWLTSLSVDLNQQYAGRQSKTLTRDINALLELGLIVRLPGNRYRARHEIMFAFMPIAGGDPQRPVLIEVPQGLRPLVAGEPPPRRAGDDA